MLLSSALICAAAICLDVQREANLCQANKGVTWHEEERVLCIDGKFDEHQSIHDAVLALDFESRISVVIRSDGGIMVDAIAITEHLEKSGYDVIIDGNCASACAQFIFLAADRKYIINEGIVAMHGGPISEEAIAAMDYSDEVKDNLRNEQQIFRQFYPDRGIGMGITTDFPQYLRDELAKGRIVFWIPKEEDYLRFGVNNVNYCNAKFRDPENVTD